MDIESLINDLDELVVIARNDEDIGVSKWLQLNGSVADVKKLLEKQTAKKVTRDSMYSPALCPNCHSDEICKDLGDGYYSYFRDIKYCPNCGQLLDWEE